MDKYKKSRIIGIIIYWIIRIIRSTLRIEIVTDNEYNKNEVYVYGFWHGKIFIPMTNMIINEKKMINIVSPSKDGEIMATIVEKYKYITLRASSDRDGLKGLIVALKKIKDGYSLGFAADGPKGPAKNVKSGLIYVAQKSGRAIVPVGSAIDSKWIFQKAWDKTEIPKPFSKCAYYIGKPFFIPKEGKAEEYINMVNEKISEAESKAEEILLKTKVRKKK